ncbi:hydroxymethylglutaryl-CoA reductase [Pseudomonas sp. TH08]|uniref:hydroxymethylglutaryl-CoA reductase n=1 Tax=unclassified Pseudomonas TaxID=196821 RepID=UPI0019148134|nr:MULTISPECIES: hydroxymethylglutaryl-CoA reductase [unclassified Pseudomonas]MBK5527800.1 hydroxymethylglutaryl-CoA reductase [Pseudomonas sp. TH06]MBK5533529.1 hydroxymethylglutaryl-CoA reductase [Pseudomonas sp. TH08]
MSITPHFGTHWIEALINGDLHLHQLPDNLTQKEAALIRREALQHISGMSLDTIGRYTFDPQPAKCENFIGAIQIPLGVAGPLLIKGQAITAQEPLYAPMATSEGALIASVSRGCSAIHAAGGALVRVEDIGITRAPVFRSTGILQTETFLAWISSHFQQIKLLCEQDSSHLQLQDIVPAVVGTSIYLRFRFHSGDAMGMNMASIACDRAITQLISPETGVPCISISGNYCTDKKPSRVNFLNGRGKRIHAEVHLSADILRDILKTDATSLCEVQYRKNLLGSAMAGTIGCNAHHANILAAFFIATGQDVAQVAESAIGITCIEACEHGAIYASILLPDTPLGTVGGGTGLSTQREALALMGIVPGTRAPGVDTRRLAEILGALVLAGELSIMAAQASHQLVQAHKRLGR